MVVLGADFGLIEHERHGGLELLVRVDVVGQDKCVFAGVVLEEVVDAELFHQPGHKIEGGFTILDAIFEHGAA